MALQVWLPLRGDTKNYGVSTASFIGSPNSWGDGIIGKCATFATNTDNGIYTLTNAFHYTDNFSWTIWVKTAYAGNNEWIFTDSRADYGGGRLWASEY